MNETSSGLLARFAGLPVRELPGGLALVEATTLRSRQRGLGGLDMLPPDQALEIPAKAVHTFTMRFGLDLIWLAGDRRILRVDRDVPRWRVRTNLHARWVIETAAGQAEGFVVALGGG